jgi:predicted metal-dependent peptidase
MTARERIQQETEQWFLTEPVFFAVYCSHRLTMNANMLCPLRTGKGRIEYNPTVIDAIQDNQLKDLLKVEMIRILLQHPYARQPLGGKPMMLQTASDMVISPAYKFSWIDLAKPEDFGLPKGQHYEWYANRLNEMAVHLDGDAPSEGNSDTNEQQGEDISAPSDGENDQSQDLQSMSQGQLQAQAQGLGQEQDQEQSEEQEQSQGQSQGQEQGQEYQGNDDTAASLQGRAGGESDSYTALWEEDQFQARQITDLVQSTTQWGSLPGNMVELIKKAAEGKIDYRGALRTFRSSILSQKRRLTRMRPSRRFGFEQMGSHYDFTTRLLIAIDTSGSVGSEELGRYFRIITTFFKYGIQEIDVLMFDDEVQGDPITFTEAKKNKQEFKVRGRGGTNFQAPIDYVKEKNNYDGLIIITDGYAPTPEVPPFLRAKLLWVIDNEPSYKKHYESLRKTGRVCLMEL